MALYSAGVEYGIHCLLFLADEKGDSRESSVRTLAELQGVPPELLAKVFTRLAKAGLVAATEGVRGGFRLARPANEISVLDVVRAIDGDKSIFECREVRERCAIFEGNPPSWATRNTCSIHAVMLTAQKRMEEALAHRPSSTWYAGWGVSRHRSSAKKCCAGWMPAGKDAAAPATSPWRIRSGAASPFRGKHHCRLRC